MAIKLKSPVGKNALTAKASKNATEDVVLLRQMLRANKFNVRPDGGCDASLCKAILNFQKKAGLKIQDGVVDPGGATFNALLPLYQKVINAAKNSNWYVVKFQNKNVKVAETDLIAIRDELFKAIRPSINKMNQRHAEAMGLYKDHIRVAQQKEGFAESVMQWVSIKYSGVDYPSGRTVFMADACMSDLNNAVRKKNVDKTKAALIAAAPAVNKFNTEMRAFHEGIVEGSSKAIKDLETTSDTSFLIFEALVTASLSKTAGNKADDIAATGTAFLKSTAQQYGRYLAGKEVSFFSVTVDTASALGTSLLGKKLGKYIDQKKLIGITGKKFAQRIRSGPLPINITNTMGEKIIEKHARGSLKDAISGAVMGALKEGEQAFKRGRLPNFDELMDHAADIVLASMAGAVMGAFAKQRPKFAHKLKKYMGDHQTLNSVKNIKNGKLFIAMSESNKKKVIDQALKTFGTKGTENGFKILASLVVESPDKDNTDQAVKEAAKDKDVSRVFEKALEDAIVKVSRG